MVGVKSTNTSTLVPHVDSEPADAGLSGMVTLSVAGNTPQGSPDQHASLRHGTRTTWNRLLWRYWNFIFLADNSPSSIWDTLVGLWICLHVISCLYTIFWGSTVWIHSTYSTTCLWSTTHFGIKGNSLNVVPVEDFFWMGHGPKIIWPKCNCLPPKKPKRVPL